MQRCRENGDNADWSILVYETKLQRATCAVACCNLSHENGTIKLRDKIAGVTSVLTCIATMILCALEVHSLTYLMI